MPQGRPARTAWNLATMAKRACSPGDSERIDEGRDPRRLWPGRHDPRACIARATATTWWCSPVSRRPRPWRVVGWDGATSGPWRREVDGSDAVINLAGRSVNCRYTPTQPARDPRFASEIDPRRWRRRSRRRAGRLESGSRPAPRPSTLTGTTHRTTRRSASSADTSPARLTPGTSASTWRKRGSARSSKP